MPPTPTLRQEPVGCVYARESAGYTMTQAARLLKELTGRGSLGHLNDIEKGRRSATPATLNALAQIYNCPRVVLERKRWFPADQALAAS